MRKIKFKNILLVLFLLMNLQSLAQSNPLVGEVLSFRDFLKIVNTSHPQARQARLIVESAKAYQMVAKGQLDPKLYYDFNNKFFDGKNYYSLSNGGVKIATRYAVEFKAGFENNGGVNLNPESGTATNGIAYMQISIPLLQGLITDERRTILKQAEWMMGMSMTDLQNAINELYYKAAKSYLEWQLSVKNLEVYEEALKTGRERLKAVKRSAELGDRPYIDTVEAAIQVQDRWVNRNQAQLDCSNKKIQVNTFIWAGNNQPMELPATCKPESDAEVLAGFAWSDESLDLLISKMEAHPLLKAYEFKLKLLDAEKKLKTEKLKPQLNVSYNPLFDAGKSSFGLFNNYKWGLQFSFPLLLRKERGELRQTKIKIEQTKLDRMYKQNELVSKLGMAINEYRSYTLQLQLIIDNQKNYQRLWEAEKKLFDRGESSLFMINTRENNLINAGIKVNEMMFKNAKAAVEIEYSLGALNIE